MYFLVYKITNTVNNKIYIGAHKTDDINDSYMGSGKLLKNAQSKYGIDKFKKEILFELNSVEEMYEKEAELVNEVFIKNPRTYNLKIGGYGGWDYCNSIITAEHKVKRGKAGAAVTNGWNKSVLNMTHEQLSEKSKRSAITTRKNHPNLAAGKNNPMYGKTHSTSAKLRISVGVSGKNNGSFGSKWVHSLELKQSKRINVSDLDVYIKNGWVIGRKIYK